MQDVFCPTARGFGQFEGDSIVGSPVRSRPENIAAAIDRHECDWRCPIRATGEAMQNNFGPSAIAISFEAENHTTVGRSPYQSGAVNIPRTIQRHSAFGTIAIA